MKKKSLQYTFKTLFDVLDNYTKADIETSFYPAARSFSLKNIDFIRKERPDAAPVLNLITEPRKKPFNKEQLMNISSLIFLTNNIYQKFRETRHPDTIKALDFLIKKGTSKASLLNEKLGIETYQTEEVTNSRHQTYYSYGRTRLKVNDLFHLLPSRFVGYGYGDNEILFLMPYELCSLLMDYHKEAIQFELPTYKDLPAEAESLSVYHGEEPILRELPGLLIYVQEKTPKLSKKGRPHANSIKGLGKKMALKEFYPTDSHKDLVHMRANMIASLLFLIKEFPAIKSMPELIKELFDRQYIEKFLSGLNLLSHVNKMTTQKVYCFLDIERVIMKEMSALPQGKWLSWNDLELQMSSFLMTHQFMDIRNASDVYFVKTPQNKSQRWDEHYYIDQYNQAEYIKIPAMKGTIFLFAAWGLIDIAYEKPDCTIYSQTADSPYDGLKWLRITPFGSYIFGNTKNYTSTVKGAFTLSLAEDSLSIMLKEGDQDLAARAIASFARPIGKSRFQTNADLFLAKCKEAQELKHKISLFSSLFPGDLPTVWQRFFQEISRKADPFKKVIGYTLYQLSAEDKELLQLIARDTQLKKICIKAEGFKVLVSKKDLLFFKNTLRSHGYLIE